MAITGSGTQADPFVVHNYTELKSACAGQPSSSYLKQYVELANDIDCNDYGENFEWEGIRGKSEAYAYSLDLKGHTIKNFKVKENQYAFYLDCQYSGTTEIKNGKILNAYLTGAAGFAQRNGDISNLKMENLSISINVSGGLYPANARYMFDDIPINACAIYIEGTMWNGNNNAVFRTWNADYPISNCDILVNFPQVAGSGHTLIRGFYTDEKAVRNCRIRGTFNTTYGVLYCGAHNCVIDLANSGTGVFSQTVQNCTGVINSDKYTGGFSGLTGVTSAEIINGDALRAKGFEVINVTA